MRGRFIRPNHTSRAPGAFIAVDTESQDVGHTDEGTERHTLTVGCAVYWRWEAGKQTCRDTLIFTDTDTFWAWVRSHLSKHRTTWLWTLNLGFDLSILKFWQEWDEGRFRDKFSCLNDPPTILSGYMSGCRLVCCDVFNWFRTSAKKLGEWHQHPKLEMPGDAATPADWQAYCMRDVEIVERTVLAINRLVRDEELGCLRYTAAAQAMQHWRHLKPCPKVAIPANPHESKIARDGYYAGRTELFYRGEVEGPIYAIDVSGMYAAAMVASEQPCKLLAYTPRASRFVLNDCLATPCLAATVTLDTGIPFPVRLSDVGTVWATGRFSTTLVGEDLAKAVRAGVVTGVGRCARYELAQVCARFADYWWDYRLHQQRAGNTILAEFAKLMPCSLYGKWAQKKDRWEPIDPIPGLPRWCDTMEYDASQKRTRRIRVRAGIAQIEGEGGEGPYSFPAISAWITATARRMMDDHRKVTGERNVYYQCNDTLYVSQAGLDNLTEHGSIDPDRLGGLRVVKTYQSATFWGINLARLDDTMHAAGLSGQHQFAPGGTYHHDTFERLNQILARQPDGSVLIRRQSFTPDMTYRHGQVTESGWVQPLHIVGE